MIKIKTLNAISDVIYDYLPKSEYEVSPDFDVVEGILVRSAKCHDIEFPEELLAIARAGAGVNNIPIDKCTEKGICVFNTPGANANAVKELVLASMFMVSRNIIPAVEWAKTLKGQGADVPDLVEKGKKNFIGPELLGKTLGVIGLGAIGVLVANAARAVGMKVIGYDPFISVESAWQLSTDIKRATDLDELLSSSDYITLHIPLMEKTKGFFNANMTKKIKKGAYLFNFSRAGIVDTEAVLSAVESERIAKYVVDFPTDDVLGVENTIAIPHLGASTPESEENCAAMAASQIRNYIEHGNIANSVNLPSCEMAPAGDARLTFIHKNTPNMVGQITTVLADKGANISNMINKGQKDVAYTIIDLDQAVNGDTKERLEQIEGMIKVRYIKYDK